MKLKALIHTLLAGIMLACSSTEEGNSNVTANSTANISIEGMTCEVGCAASIEKKLNNTDGIASADVDFEGKSASISFDNTMISENEIEELIEGMNDGQYEVEMENSDDSNNDSKIISSESDNGLDAHSFSFEVPNLFSVLKGIL